MFKIRVSQERIEVVSTVFVSLLKYVYSEEENWSLLFVDILIIKVYRRFSSLNSHFVL